MTTLPEVIVVALTLYLEAGNQPYAGKVMVGDVIKNRSAICGKPLKVVCLQKNQFSCWNRKQPRKVWRKLKLDCDAAYQSWVECMTVARMVCKPDYTPATPATYYLNPKTANKKTMKIWKKTLHKVAVVCDHVFYREKK